MRRATQATRHAPRRADPRDEEFHPVGDDPTWSESYYFYYFDPAREIGGYTRLGFRPHDGWRDALHILYLAGQRIGFAYQREDHDAKQRRPAVGATSLSMAEPFGAWRIEFDGELLDCPDGRVLVTPRKERAPGWSTTSSARLSLDFGGLPEPSYADREGDGGHFEQFGTARGELRIGEQTFPIEGLGLRDKSWGPRPWTNQTGADDRDEAPDSPFGQGPGWRVYGSWLTAAFSPDLAFAVGASPAPGGGLSAQGFLMKDGANHALTGFELACSYQGTTLFQDRCRFVAHFEDGTTLSARGEALNHGPSKIPHPVGATVVNAAMTRFTLDTGEQALGITEYHSSVRRVSAD